MKGLEGMPMRVVEERVRDAFTAAAETITAQDLPGLPTPRRSRAARRLWARAPRARMHILAPAAAAAAVAVIVVASLAISGVIQRLAGTGPASSSGVFAKVPRFFVALPQIPGRAVVGATATGAVVGTVAPPKPYTVFTWVAAAGDGRTFVFGAAPGLDRGPVRFYRLVLDRSAHPAPLVPLPIAPETGTISGLALSPNGSKLAVSLLGPVHDQIGSKIQVFSLATGAGREWVWPGNGTIGELYPGVSTGSHSWQANNRTLLFEVNTRTRNGSPGQLRLLDTAAAAGSLLASSTRIPVPSTDVGWQSNNANHRIIGLPLISGDGTKLVAPFFHESAPPKVFGFTITEFSVRTGKPVQVLYQRRTSSEANSTNVLWVNTSGTAMIAARGNVFGVQTTTTFTPLPASTRRLIGGHELLPAW